MIINELCCQHHSHSVCAVVKKEGVCTLVDTCLCFKLQYSADANCPPQMKDLVTNFPFKKLGIYTMIAVIFTYNVLLEKDVECTCKQQTNECHLYMALPAFIIFFFNTLDGPDISENLQIYVYLSVLQMWMQMHPCRVLLYPTHFQGTFRRSSVGCNFVHRWRLLCLLYERSV